MWGARNSYVKPALDTNDYESNIEISDDQLAKDRLAPHPCHGDWRPGRDTVNTACDGSLLFTP